MAAPDSLVSTADGMPTGATIRRFGFQIRCKVIGIFDDLGEHRDIRGKSGWRVAASIASTFNFPARACIPHTATEPAITCTSPLRRAARPWDLPSREYA